MSDVLDAVNTVEDKLDLTRSDVNINGEGIEAILDSHRLTGSQDLDGGTELDLLDTSNDTNFVLDQFYVDLNTMGAGDTIVFAIYTTEGGTERLISTAANYTFTNAQTPARVALIGDLNSGRLSRVWAKEGLRITAQQTATGTYRTIEWFAYPAK